MAFPSVFAGESLPTLSLVVAAWNSTVELLLPFMSVIDMTLKMSFGSKTLATVRVRAFVVFCVVALMVSIGS